MAKRKTIRANPLDTLVPDPAAPARVSRRGPAPSRVEKDRFTVHVTKELVNRVKNASYWTPGLTLADLAEDALGNFIDKLEKKRGEPFPQRDKELRGGRPFK